MDGPQNINRKVSMAARSPEGAAVLDVQTPPPAKLLRLSVPNETTSFPHVCKKPHSRNIIETKSIDHYSSSIEGEQSDSSSASILGNSDNSVEVLQGAVLPSVNLSHLHTSHSHLSLEMNKSQNLGLERDILCPNTQCSGLSIQETSSTTLSSEKPDNAITRDPLYLSLKEALDKWRRKSNQGNAIQHVTNLILGQYKEGEAKFVMPSYYQLDSFPNLGKCALKIIEAQYQLITYLYYDDLPRGLSVLNLAHNQLDNEHNVFLILCRCTFLKTLILKDNHLSNIFHAPVCHPLKNLDLSNNKISSLNLKQNVFSSYTDLSFLSLSGNNLDFLSSCPVYLKCLNISRMAFKDSALYALEHLHVLEELDLSYNSLTVLPKHISTKIRKINLSHNNIKNEHDELSFERFYEIEIVNIAGNQLTRFPCIHNNVKEIFFSFNQITTDESILRLIKLSNLTTIDLGNNNLTEFPFNLSEKLESINVTRNKITRYDRDAQFSSVCMKEVYITGNPICQDIAGIKGLFRHEVQVIV